MTDTSAASGLHIHFASLDPEPLLAAPPALIEFLPVAVFACDSSGRLRWFNGKAAEIWGRSPEPGETVAASCEPLAEALRTGESALDRATTVERPDASRVAATIHVTALRDCRGDILGAIACFHDCSEQMRKDRAARDGEQRLFGELNHRIKNNMQMLYALLAAARRETDSAEARIVLDEAVRRVGAMAAAQTALYRADNLDRFDSAPFMASVCAAAEAGCDSGACHRAPDGAGQARQRHRPFPWR